MCLHMKRFTKNNFFVEKNPTIVNFPVKNLELKDIIPVPEVKNLELKDIIPVPEESANSKYDLVANIVHDGVVNEGKTDEGNYRVHIHRKVEEIWYEVQDLRVIDILPQMVALSESYFQVYEQRARGAKDSAEVKKEKEAAVKMEA
eukprot:gene31404-6570_t